MKHICNCVRVAFYQMGLCYGNIPDLHSVDSWFESGADYSLLLVNVYWGLFPL